LFECVLAKEQGTVLSQCVSWVGCWCESAWRLWSTKLGIEREKWKKRNPSVEMPLEIQTIQRWWELRSPFLSFFLCPSHTLNPKPWPIRH
jgi:hypothetical protein